MLPLSPGLQQDPLFQAALLPRTEQTDVVVRGLIQREDGAVLLLRRSLKDDFGGQWELPGGGADDEPPLRALARESLEESGMRILEVLALLGVRYFPMPPPHRCYEERIFLARAGGEPTLSPEHDAFRWLHPLEPCQEPMSETTRAALAQMARLQGDKLQG